MTQEIQERPSQYAVWHAEQRLYYTRKRAEAIQMLGGKCIHCGFDDVRALQIDHIDGGGAWREQEEEHLC